MIQRGSLTRAPRTLGAIQTAKDTLQMVADGAPHRFRCERCAEQGIMMAFRTQRELIAHYTRNHGA